MHALISPNVKSCLQFSSLLKNCWGQITVMAREPKYWDLPPCQSSVLSVQNRSHANSLCILASLLGLKVGPSLLLFASQRDADPVGAESQGHFYSLIVMTSEVQLRGSKYTFFYFLQFNHKGTIKILKLNNYFFVLLFRVHPNYSECGKTF